MLDFVGWYFSSLGDFWSSAIRIGLPQILLVVLLICWLRRRGCGKSRAKGCCWGWWGGPGGDQDDGDCCPQPCCPCPRRCCQESAAPETDADGGEEG